MLDWQRDAVLLFGVVNLAVCIKGFYESSRRKNSYGLTYALFPLGMFVWGDAVIFGLFWAGVSAAALVLEDWILFWMVFSLFWVVRSVGETIYWFNQQFSGVTRWKAEDLPGYRFFHNDSIWFVYQIMCQAITVVSLVGAIYFSALWLTERL